MKVRKIELWTKGDSWRFQGTVNEVEFDESIGGVPAGEPVPPGVEKRGGWWVRTLQEGLPVEATALSYRVYDNEAPSSFLKIIGAEGFIDVNPPVTADGEWIQQVRGEDCGEDNRRGCARRTRRDEVARLVVA